VASERRLRLRLRAGFAAGVDAETVARWRDSLAAVDALAGSAGALDLARFLADTGGFIKSLFPCAFTAHVSAEILQHFPADVQQRHVHAAGL
jgi:hypothetical protein